jgi:hypothetical protein
MHRLRSFLSYYRDLAELKRQQGSSDIPFPFGRAHPCLQDRGSEGGTASGHYFHQDLLVARRICVRAPRLHVDIGSRIDGFVAHVASFREIEVFDVRPVQESVPNIRFRCVDFMGSLDEQFIDYCDSVSCLHALEHFGLGRYGDRIKCDGYVDGLENMRKMLQANGACYLSVPIGPQRIEFNAHRVFAMEYLLDLFSDKFRIECFSFVDDQGHLHEAVPLHQAEVTKNFDCTYGCGIFEMTKC